MTTSSPYARTPADFVAHVRRARALLGFETRAAWLSETTATITVRHPYGPWCGVTIFNCNGDTCESENGSPMLAPDVVFRLREMLKKDTPWERKRIR
jgi:hypothetical protein